MDILLFTIVKSPGAVALTESTKSISKDGASIGRGSSNSWVLPDPERYLSSVHTEIIFKDEKFFAIDQSTNGTFYNDPASEIGKGNEVELHDGDRLIIGDYEIEVSLLAESNEDVSSNGPFAEASAVEVEQIPPLAAPIDIPGFDDLIPMNNAPFSSSVSQHLSNDHAILQNEEILDPLIALSSSSEPINELYSTGTQGDAENIMNHAMQFPEMIPDNWFDLPLPGLDEQVEAAQSPVTEMDSSPQAIHRQRLISEIGIGRKTKSTTDTPNKPLTPKPALRKAKKKKPNPINKNYPDKQINNEVAEDIVTEGKHDTSIAVSANEDLVAALGLNIQDMNEDQIAEINDVVGEFTKIAVKGLMLILKSRSSLKSEFRMNVTTIQSAENNPLKFSPTLEDAMFNMFVRGGNAYKDPVTAVKEGIEGVADHQFSVFAGMRSAFDFLLERFNPKILEAKFEKQKSNSLLSSKKAKNWDLYTSLYQDIIKDRDDSFQYLFGDEFVQAYEQQMQQLNISRANKE